MSKIDDTVKEIMDTKDFKKQIVASFVSETTKCFAGTAVVLLLTYFGHYIAGAVIGFALSVRCGFNETASYLAYTKAKIGLELACDMGKAVVNRLEKAETELEKHRG